MESNQRENRRTPADLVRPIAGKWRIEHLERGVGSRDRPSRFIYSPLRELIFSSLSYC